MTKSKKPEAAATAKSDKPARKPSERLDQFVAFVKANPGCTKLQATLSVTPHVSFGYALAKRAIELGLITAEQDVHSRGRSYKLFAVPSKAEAN